MRGKQRILIALLTAVPVGAAVHAAQPGPAAEIASAVEVAAEHLGAGSLTITPVMGYVRATLVIRGPREYRLERAYRGGSEITADLAVDGRWLREEAFADQRIEWTSGVGLPDGRYRYSLKLHSVEGLEGSLTGVFFVEDGAMISREEKRAELAVLRHELNRPRVRDDHQRADATGVDFASDAFLIRDDQRDGSTFLTLDGYPPFPPDRVDWSVANYYNDFRISESRHGVPSARLEIEELTGYVGVGLGSYSPNSSLEISHPNYPEIVLRDPFNGGEVEIQMESGTGHLSFSQNDYATMFLEAGTGRVGVGTNEPVSRLTVGGSESDASTVQVQVRNTSLTTAPRQLLGLVNNGPPQIALIDSSIPHTWLLSHSPVGNLIIQENGVTQLILTSAGDLGIRGTLRQGSSRALKEAFQPADPEEILTRLRQLPISTWKYKADEAKLQHVGPTSEDFHRLFGLGDDDGIAIVDTSGIALAAIQELDRTLAARDGEFERLLAARDTEIATLREKQKAELGELSRRLEEVELANAALLRRLETLGVTSRQGWIMPQDRRGH